MASKMIGMHHDIANYSRAILDICPEAKEHLSQAYQANQTAHKHMSEAEMLVWKAVKDKVASLPPEVESEDE